MPKTLEFDKALSDEIVSMRNDGSKWDQIAEAVELPAGKCMLVYNHATVRPKDKIKNATPEQVVELRDEERLSWGVISARTGYPESSLRGMYEEATNKSTKGNRIGKGGRHPGEGTDTTPRKPRAAKKTAAKKSAAGKGAGSPLEGKSAEEVEEMILHRGLKVLSGDSEEVVKVKSVKKVTAKTVSLTNEEGKARTIKRDAIVAISKNKVLKG